MKAERKYLAHYLDSNWNAESGMTDYVRIGKNLEEFSIELNPDVTVTKNILGENSVQHGGYEVSADASPVYYEYNDSLTQKILEFAMGRKTGDACRTTYVEVLLQPNGENKPTVIGAYREDVYVIPNSYGGDTSGLQVPFTLHFAGNRVPGDFDLESNEFLQDPI